MIEQIEYIIQLARKRGHNKVFCNTTDENVIDAVAHYCTAHNYLFDYARPELDETYFFYIV